MFLSNKIIVTHNPILKTILIPFLLLICIVTFFCVSTMAEASSKKHHIAHKKIIKHSVKTKTPSLKKHHTKINHVVLHHIKHHDIAHKKNNNISGQPPELASDISISYDGDTMMADVQKKSQNTHFVSSEKTLAGLTTLTKNDDNASASPSPQEPGIVESMLNALTPTPASSMPSAESKTTDLVKNTVPETPSYISKQPVTDTASTTSSYWHPNFAVSIEKHLVNFVHKVVADLHYSDYKLGGKKFDTSHGIYIVDCSSFVDHILQRTTPQAYLSLVNATGADAPATQHYYEFFTELSTGTDNFWNKVNEVDQLRAGDILVFRYKNSRGAETGGHVMVVMDKPIRDSDVFFVRVADSAPSRHSQDTRQRNEAGIGIGTLLLKINPHTGHPAAYAWGLGGLWNRNVNFAMARPLDTSNFG